MKNLNIKDIARLAGVGVSTVSRVINNHPDVKDETRQKVMELIDEYDYIPNNSARNLKRISSNNIGVMIKGRFNPFFSKMLEVIEEKINKNGYSMIIHYNDEEPDDIQKAIELIKEKRLLGLICLGGVFDRVDESNLVELETPLVFASSDILVYKENSKFSSILIDNEKSSYEAVDFLCRNNHKRIGILTTEYGEGSISYRRLNGYKNALGANGIEFDEKLVYQGEFSFESGYDGANGLLDSDDEITAIFATSDIMAIGASKAILSRGLKIPEDVSIIGFDGLDYTKYFHPSLTTVKQPIRDIGLKCVEILFELLDDKDNKHLMMETELILRDSCITK